MPPTISVTVASDELALPPGDLAQIDQRPNLEGRNMTMMLSPSKAVINGTWEPPSDEDDADADERIARQIAQFFVQYDVWLSPTLAESAPRHKRGSQGTMQVRW